MANKIEICNKALAALGAAPIVSITEESSEAKRLNQIWDMSLEGVLREYPWNFALATVELAQTANKPPDFTYEYQLPSDSLYVVEIISPSLGRDYTEYKVRGTTLVTDESTVCIEYVKVVDDSARFDSLFAEALAWYLASQLAAAITGDSALGQRMAGAYALALSKARGMNGNESRRSLLHNSKLVQSRKG